MANLFEHFDHLSARGEGRRREGVSALTSYLLSASAHTLTYRDIPAFEYSIQRLVKGLSAYHGPTLHGYATSLACVLDSLETVEPRTVCSLIEKHLVSPPMARGSEAKGYKVGQLLALSAISRCDRFSAADSDLKSQLFKLVLEFFARDSYLKTASAQVISDSVSSLTAHDVKLVLPLLSDKLESCSLADSSPDKLAILLSVCAKFPRSKQTSRLLQKCVQVARLDSEEQLTPVCDVILRCVSSRSLHPSLPLSIQYFLTTELFHSFWNALVEEGIFEMDLQRKCTAFDVFFHSIKSDPPLPHVFSCLSPSLVQLFRSAAQTEREPLHSRGIKTVRDIIFLINNKLISSSTRIGLELCLFSPNLSPKLSILYRESQVTPSDSDDTLGFIHFIFEHFLKETELIRYPPPAVHLSELANPVLASQDYSLSLVLSLCRRSPLTPQLEEPIIKFLTTHAYFSLQKSSKSFFPPTQLPHTPVSPEIRARCRETLFLVLTESLSLQTRKLAYFSQLGFAAKWAFSLLVKSTHATLCVDSMDTQTRELLSTVHSLTTDLERDLEVEPTKPRSALLTLTHYYILLLLTNPTPHNKSSLIKLVQSYVTLPQGQDPLSADAEGLKELTAVILSTLSHNTQLSRALAEILFRSIVSYVTRDAVLLLADAAFDLEQTETQIDETESEAEEGSQAGDPNESGTLESDKGTSSDEETDGERELSLVERDLLFKTNVRVALEEAASDHGSDAESLDMDQDEERLKGIDIALSELFREKLKTQNPKRLEREREITSLHFRIRVLSLVQILIEKHTDSPLMLYLVVPASECILASSRNNKLKEFSSKLVTLFSKKLCAVKCKPDVSSEFMCVVLKREFHLAVSAATLELAKIISNGVSLVLKIMRRADMLGDCSTKVTEIVGECLKHLAEKNHGYQWNIPFLRLVEFAPLIACSIVPSLIELINANSYKFQTRKCEDILQCILLSPHCSPHLHPHMALLHLLYTAKLSAISSIENANYCHTVLSLVSPYCQLLAGSRALYSVESLSEEIQLLIEQIAETERISKSQRLSRTCASLARALEGDTGRSRRKRNRRAKGGGDLKKIHLVN